MTQYLDWGGHYIAIYLARYAHFLLKGTASAGMAFGLF